jgi:hypothetical protein
MAAISFPSSTSPGVRRMEGAGRLVNAFVEQLGEGAAAPFVTRRSPGLKRFSSSAGGVLPYRGAFFVPQDALLYVAWLGELYKVTAGGAPTSIGIVAGSAPVTFARNNKTPVADKVVVTGDGQVYTFTTTTVTALVDPDLPAPNSVCFLDGYFFFTTPDGRCFASDINGTGINALNYTRAEAYADGLLRGVVRDRDLLLWGPQSCEVWSNTANPTGFPFSRTTVIGRGLLNAWSITGWEPGFIDGLVFVGDDCLVYALSGYQPKKISPPDLDHILHQLTTAEKLEVKCFACQVAGHSLVVIHGPTTGRFCWVYDISTDQWHERISFKGQIETRDWRLRGNMVAAFGGQWVGGDSYISELWSIDAREQREGEDPLVYRIDSAPMIEFPAKIVVPKAQFLFAGGQGDVEGSDPTETNPRVEISWSDDGGNTFSRPILRELGREGHYDHAVTINRLGRTGRRGRVWRIQCSDPRYIGFLSGDMEAAIG